MTFAALKEGVKVGGLSARCVLAMLVAYDVFSSHGVPFFLTSVCDGVHGEGSKHYDGDAFDCRLPSRYTHDTTLDRKIVAELAGRLGEEFDVVLESDHLHLEFDPEEEKTA